MIIKKYTYTEWMRGKNFVLTGLGCDWEKDDHSRVSKLIESAGGIIRSSTVLDTDYLIYDLENGSDSTKMKRARELNATRGKNIQIMTVEEFDRKVNDKTKGKEENIPVSSAICLLTGDQTKCWVQNLKIVYSSLPLEQAKLIFEVYNIIRGEYAMAAACDKDTSYSGLFGLDDEILAAREKLRSAAGIDAKFLKKKSEDERAWTVQEILDADPSRYERIREYLNPEEHSDESFDFAICPVKTEEYHWIDLCRVSKTQYDRYTSELHHVYNVAELFDPDALPFDMSDPETVTIFGTGKFEAFADLSYGC